MTRRFVLAGLSHETNTFSPQPTTLERFGGRTGQADLLAGDAAIAQMTGTRTPLGGYLDVLAPVDAELVVPLAASAVPSGRVTDGTALAASGTTSSASSGASTSR